MAGFCEESDVKDALQKQELKGPIGSGVVKPSIEAATRWFANATNGWWYDSGGSTTLVPTSNASATNVRLDVPSSPHRQDAQLWANTVSRTHVRYPVTHYGPYARIRLPHPYVSSVTKLDVRERGGDVEDWVAEGDIDEGRGEDYYVERKGQHSYGKTYLYIRASAIGVRRNFDGLLTAEYDYGLDYQTEAWDDVKRGIANLAAADVMDEDDVITQIPEQGTLVGLDTQHQNLLNTASKYLDPYL